MESRFRGETTFEEETKVVTVDGREVTLHLMITRLEQIGGKPLSLTALIDITDRSLAQEKLQQVQGDFAHAARVSMLGELTATIAHEVNQPIAAIRTNGETALRWLDRLEPNIKKARDAIQRILNDASRASEVVKRIRGMVSGQPPQSVAFDLHEVIGRSLLFLQHEFQSKDVSVSLDLDPALPMVHGDPTQLQQVVVNLAVNAVQALAKSEATQRSIGIRTHQTDRKTVCCIIEDSGPGIDPEHLRRLFESFFTTKETGMGLGLPIVRSIIENHGGHIHADNDSALGGARFIFELPEGEAAVD
jgi:C4-dicarboxylate-specific signal transduction histidine kinase